MDKICKHPLCELSAYKIGLCNTHYIRLRRGGDMDAPVRKYRGRNTAPLKCKAMNCENDSRVKDLCLTHYARYRKGDLREDIPIGGNGPSWYKNYNGYMEKYVSDSKRKGGRRVVLQHRQVMEENIGRKLVEGENVHHKNGDRTDNRIENLELWNTRQPKGQRVEDKLAWAYEIIALYEPGVN